MNVMKFSEYTYVRVDVEKVRADYAALTERVQNACTAEDVFACVEEHEKIAKHVGTMLTIANIRNTIDTRDPFYEAEKAFIDENGRFWTKRRSVLCVLSAKVLSVPRWRENTAGCCF